MRILVILISGITLSACSALMVGGGTVGGTLKTEKDRPSQTSPSNAVVDDRVTVKIAADPMLANLGVDVSASGGMVTLSGSVPTYAAREAAEKLAMATDGVKSVDNQITVENQN